MFWRVLRRSVFANGGRLFVILLALGAGAAITAALLNLQVDAKRRITTEFRAFGSNVIVRPPTNRETDLSSKTLSESLLRQIWQDAATGVENVSGKSIVPAAFLYVVGDVATEGSRKLKVVIVGVQALGLVNSVAPTWKFEPPSGPEWDGRNCLIGSKVAAQLHTSANSILHVTLNEKEFTCSGAFTVSTGGPEDDQVFAILGEVQRLAGLPDQISLIQVFVPGAPTQVQTYVTALR